MHGPIFRFLFFDNCNCRIFHSHCALQTAAPLQSENVRSPSFFVVAPGPKQRQMQIHRCIILQRSLYQTGRNPAALFPSPPSQRSGTSWAPPLTIRSRKPRSRRPAAPCTATGRPTSSSAPPAGGSPLGPGTPWSGRCRLVLATPSDFQPVR